MDKKEEFLKRILATFRIEAGENIDFMTSNLIELEKHPDGPRKKELIEFIYRSAHSLKGAARAVDLSETESICHAFEGVMSQVRHDKLQLYPEIFDVFHQTVDLIKDLVNLPDNNISEDLSQRITKQIKLLSTIENGEAIKELPETKGKENPDIKTEKKSVKNENVSSMLEERPVNITGKNETIRISVKKLDKLLAQAEELTILKFETAQRIEDIKKILQNLWIYEKEYSAVSPSIQYLKQQSGSNTNELPSKEAEDLIRFYHWGNSHLLNLTKELHQLHQASFQELNLAESNIELLHDNVKRLISVPFSDLLNVFPKMVRDISKDLGKETEFVTEGHDIEIDRRILEKIKAPLIHILRNSIDYGIESPQERLKKHKPEKGKISVKIKLLENNNVEICISDDGAGINIEKIKQQYIKNENISEEALTELNEQDLLNYIFRPGISTSDMITELSGRGLGLAIVEENVDLLGGSVKVETEKDKSTVFRIKLPQSMVTSRGVLCLVSDQEFIIPTAHIQQILRIHKNEIKTVENKIVIPFNGKVIPLVALNKILGFNMPGNTPDFFTVMVLSDKGKYIGFLVEDVMGEQEILFRDFNKPLVRVRHISGATVLGSGKIAPVLRVNDLFAAATGSISSLKDVQDKDDKEKEQKSVLVVEDSITSRTLLKNILEAQGFRVTTAVDGIEGFTKLIEGSYNAVISDIEMPRMNGFELTEKIRSDKEKSGTPVLLVTSLSKREDREKGIDVGANAYIVKNNFDQGNLLEILNRLI